MNICWNDVVQLSDGRKGIVKFIGPTDFKTGNWYGLFLPRFIGKNTGVINNRKYFTCSRHNRGLFVPVEKIAQILQHSVYSRLVGFNARVRVKNRGVGTVKFIGETYFRQGIWYGIELDGELGRNNGSVNNVKYFKCRNNYGIFVREKALKLLDESVKKEKRKRQRIKPDIEDDEKSDIIMWKCRGCKRVNQSDFLYCPICGRFRDDNNSKLSKELLEMYSDSRLHTMSTSELKGEIMNLRHQLIERQRTIDALLEEHGFKIGHKNHSNQSLLKLRNLNSNNWQKEYAIISPHPGDLSFANYIDDLIGGIHSSGSESPNDIAMCRPKLRMTGLSETPQPPDFSMETQDSCPNLQDISSRLSTPKKNSPIDNTVLITPKLSPVDLQQHFSNDDDFTNLNSTHDEIDKLSPQSLNSDDSVLAPQK